MLSQISTFVLPRLAACLGKHSMSRTQEVHPICFIDFPCTQPSAIRRLIVIQACSNACKPYDCTLLAACTQHILSSLNSPCASQVASNSCNWQLKTVLCVCHSCNLMHALKTIFCTHHTTNHTRHTIIALAESFKVANASANINTLLMFCCACRNVPWPKRPTRLRS